MTDRSVTKHEHSFGKPFDLRGDGLVEQCSTCDHIRPFTNPALTSNEQGIPSPALLRRWAADPANTMCWGLDRIATELERLQRTEGTQDMALMAQVGRLRAALESIGEYDCPGGVHPKHCIGCAACDANKALSADEPVVETKAPPWRKFTDELPSNNGRMIWWADGKSPVRLVAAYDFDAKDEGHWMYPMPPRQPGSFTQETSAPLPVVTDRAQGVDCYLCEDGTPHTHVPKAPVEEPDDRDNDGRPYHPK